MSAEGEYILKTAHNLSTVIIITFLMNMLMKYTLSLWFLTAEIHWFDDGMTPVCPKWRVQASLIWDWDLGKIFTVVAAQDLHQNWKPALSVDPKM